MKKSLFLGIVLSLFLVFLTANFTFALSLPNPIDEDSLEGVIGAIVGFVWQLAIIIAPLMFIIAGFFYITSGGEPERVKKARNIFVYTLIGLVIVLVATGLYQLIANILGAEEDGGDEDGGDEANLDFCNPHYVYNKNYCKQMVASG